MTSLTPLAPEAIRARKRPLAVLLLFVAELAWALVMASPAHAWAGRVWGAHPAGDGVLWEPGGRHLLVWLGQNDAGMGVATRTTFLLLVIGTVVMQLPLGALLVSLGFSRGGAEERAVRPLTAMRVSLGTFLPLAGFLAVGSLLGLLLLAVGSMASSAVDSGLVERLGDARSFQLRLVTLAVFAALAALVGVVVDLARAAVARDAGLAAANGTSSAGFPMMSRAVRTALATARRGFLRAIGAWAWRWALGIALIGLGYLAAHMLGGREDTPLVLLFIAHQAVVLARVALRASWLARATAFIAPVQDGTPTPTATTAAPAAPSDEAAPVPSESKA